MQDFNHRISIVVNKELPSWQVLNSVAHVSAYFGHKLEDRFDTGENFTSSDDVIFPRNSQFPIIVLSASPEELPDFVQKVRAQNEVQSMFFIKEMIETTNDEEIIKILSKKTSLNVEVLGVGIFGTNQQVKDLTQGFKLWK